MTSVSVLYENENRISQVCGRSCLLNHVIHILLINLGFNRRGFDMAGALFLALLCLGCWRSFVTANDPCIPEVRGEPFVQYAKNKNCEVDEKLLKMFNPLSFNDSVVNKPFANFMCTGFIDALNQAGDSTLENLCVIGLLDDIRDADFCSDDKIMRVLEEVVDSAVFDKISKTVSNFTRHHCDMMCSSSNELCWAFGITAKLVLKQSVMSTTAPTTEPTTAPTTEPTTATVSLPDLFTAKPPQPSDDHADDDVDTTGEPTDDNKNDPSKLFQGGISDVQTPPVASSHEDVDGTAGTDASDEPEIPISPNTNDSQDVQNNVTINDNDSDTTENPTAASPTNDNATTIIANTTVTAKPTTDNTTTAATNASESASAQNVTTLEGYISEEEPPASDPIPVDVDDGDSFFTEDAGQTNQEDQSDHDNSDHSSIVDHVVDMIDDDDDDGYSYWHFAAILLFILFLGVAGYLASHNRKKVKNHHCTSMCNSIVVVLLQYGYIVELLYIGKTFLSVNFQQIRTPIYFIINFY